MHQNLSIFTSRFVNLSVQESDELLSIFKPYPVKRLNHLFLEGELVDSIYFINEGVLRGYYTKEGVEYTAIFLFGPTMFTDVTSIRKKVSSLINLQALKATDCLVAKFSDLEELANKHPNIEHIFFKFMEHLYLFGVTRQLSFIYDTPQERYIKLFSERPKVIAEIPQHYIASYLGIKPETLSRIRKRIL